MRISRPLPRRITRALQAGLLAGALVAYVVVFAFLLRRPPGVLQPTFAPVVILAAWWFRLRGGVAAPAAFFLANLGISLALGRAPIDALDDAIAVPLFAAAVVGPAVGLVQRERDLLRERAHALADEIVREREAARRVTESAERLRTLGTLVAGVAHEVNNPLAYMRLNLEENDWVLATYARDGSLPEPVRSGLSGVIERNGVVLEGIEQVARITRNLRRVAKPGDGNRAPVDVNELVLTTSEVARPRFPLAAAPEHDLRALRRPVADAAELHQVLLNLLLNAADVTPPDGRVRVRTFDEDGHVVIEVEDEGPGIPPDAQAKVFTPFFTTKPQGTGLGLSISHRIVEDHGGALSFTTAPGRGAVFRVRLPARDDAP